MIRQSGPANLSFVIFHLSFVIKKLNTEGRHQDNAQPMKPRKQAAQPTKSPKLPRGGACPRPCPFLSDHCLNDDSGLLIECPETLALKVDSSLNLVGH